MLGQVPTRPPMGDDHRLPPSPTTGPISARATNTRQTRVMAEILANPERQSIPAAPHGPPPRLPDHREDHPPTPEKIRCPPDPAIPGHPPRMIPRHPPPTPKPFPPEPRPSPSRTHRSASPLGPSSHRRKSDNRPLCFAHHLPERGPGHEVCAPVTRRQTDSLNRITIKPDNAIYLTRLAVHRNSSEDGGQVYTISVSGPIARISRTALARTVPRRVTTSKAWGT